MRNEKEGRKWWREMILLVSRLIDVGSVPREQCYLDTQQTQQTALQ